MNQDQFNTYGKCNECGDQVRAPKGIFPQHDIQYQPIALDHALLPSLTYICYCGTAIDLVPNQLVWDTPMPIVEAPEPLRLVV